MLREWNQIPMTLAPQAKLKGFFLVFPGSFFGLSSDPSAIVSVKVWIEQLEGVGLGVDTMVWTTTRPRSAMRCTQPDQFSATQADLGSKFRREHQ